MKAVYNTFGVALGCARRASRWGGRGGGRGRGAEGVLELLGNLVEQSLIAAEPGEDGGEVRYGMLEPVRQYGLERLEHGDAGYYLVLAERA